MFRTSARAIANNAYRMQARAAYRPQQPQSQPAPSQPQPQQQQQQQPPRPSPPQTQQTQQPQLPEDSLLSSDDWSKSFSGLSTQRVDAEVEKLLTQPVDELDVEVKPGGWMMS